MSSSISRSKRYEGGVTVNSEPERACGSCRRLSRPAIWSSENCTPMILLARLERSRTGLRCGSAPAASLIGPAAPPQTSNISCVARSIASDVAAKSTPRSKRKAASLESAKRRARPATAEGLNHAASRNTSAVDPETALPSPPMIPPCASGRILEEDSAFFVQRGLRRSHGGHSKRRSGQDRDFARDAPQAQAVPAVRRELERDELIIQ